MTRDEASAAYGSSLKPANPVSERERSCFYVFPGGKLGPISFMVFGDRIARVDITGPGPLTAVGVGVGSSEADVLEAYAGRVTLSAHKYTGPEGHYLTVELREEFAIVFETDGTRVTRYRAGRRPEVGWVEGCS